MSLQEKNSGSTRIPGLAEQDLRVNISSKGKMPQPSQNLTQGQMVYTKDERLGWIPATVVGVSEGPVGSVTLELGDGQRLKKKVISVLLRSEHTNYAEVSNLTEVTPINEATVLECLHRRFSSDQFYTLAGSTVVAINPFKDVFELYSMQNIWNYYENKNKEALEPHVYLIADKAYTCLKRRLGWINQSIVVSGESGAGKTVSAKHLLRYLTIVSSPEGEIDLDTSVPGSVIERRVLDSNPLLEAFGNAATPRNDNSSRFGKFIQLQFHRNGTILGGVIQTYLLEKTRVVHQRQGENNFHIFYQLLGLQEEPQIPAFLAPVKAEIQASRLECSLTSRDDGNDSLLTTLNAMTEIGITPSSQVAIFQVLLAILHLITLKFLPERDGESSEYSEDQDTARAKEDSARLLGVSSQSLHYSLLNRSIVSGDEDRPSRRSVFFKPVMVAEAESRRDCLAMLLYSKLFDWLVTFINHQIKVDHFDHSIGLLDIYGFEAFEENSLEQLCINYANERLQQHYVVHFLSDLQKEYEAEGIAWKSVPYTDNKRCVEALDGPTGVFGVLNEDVYLNRRSVDHQVCNRIIEACDSSRFVFKPHFGTYGIQFIISHFAGNVLYTVTDAVTKNKDSIPIELISLLQSSSNSFVLQLFSDCGLPSPSQTKTPRAGKSHRKKTVLAKFKSSLDSLLASLGQSDVHYIRCIKPNTQSRQGEFDRAFVLQQLRACGTIQTVDICRRGYPARMAYQEFVLRYQVFTRFKGHVQQLVRDRSGPVPWNMASEMDKENWNTSGNTFLVKVEHHLSKLQCAQNVAKESKDNQNTQRLSARILAAVFEPGLLAGVEEQFGHSKIFLTQIQVERLEETRSLFVHHVVCYAQAWWRGHLTRQRYQQFRHSALVIQTSWRAHQQRRRFKEMREAARVIQRGWSSHRLRRSLGSLSRASQTVKRSLVKWVRRGKFQKALAKLRHSKDKTKEAKAEAVSETDEETSLSAALTDDVDVLEDPYPEEPLDFPHSSTLLADIQHSEYGRSWTSPSLSNLFVMEEESSQLQVAAQPIQTEQAGAGYGDNDQCNQEERTFVDNKSSRQQNLHERAITEYNDSDLCGGDDNRATVDIIVSVDSPDPDNTVSSGNWSEDSGVMTQSESAGGPGNTKGDANGDKHHPLLPKNAGLLQPVGENQKDPLPENVVVLQPVGENEDNLSSDHCHQNAESSTTHGSTSTKRPRVVFPADTRDGKENAETNGRAAADLRSPAMKRMRRSSEDVGGAGDCGRSKRGGRRREDLYMSNGVLTCRRPTKSGYRFHVRSSVLKHGHRTPRSLLPQGLPDALPSDDEDGDGMRNQM